MATLSQITANQKNAQFSTGPRTAEGKQTSSANATAHGMTSAQVVLPHENRQQYETVRAGFLKTWRPATELEVALTIAVTDTWWRLQRQRRIETALMSQRINAVCETNPDLDPDTALAFLMTDPAEMKRMSLMLRYVNAAERAHTKAIRELEQIQKLRRNAERESSTDAPVRVSPQPEALPRTYSDETDPIRFPHTAMAAPQPIAVPTL